VEAKSRTESWRGFHCSIAGLGMSLNPKEKTLYLVELARGYLGGARKAFAMRDFADTMTEAQLSVENSAKAVISCLQIPSWSHDPSEELLNILVDNKAKIAQLLG